MILSRRPNPGTHVRVVPMQNGFVKAFSQGLGIFKSQRGFSLLEIALVVVVIGIIIGMGFVSWRALVEGNRLATSRSALTQAKDCLIRRMILSRRYPSFTPVPNCSSPDPVQEVDDCLCSIKDGWGRRVYFLGGLAASGASLSGLPVIDMTAQGQNATALSTDSRITDGDGTVRDNVAFVLICFGANFTADHPSYGSRFPTTTTLAATMDATMPNFSVNIDDIYLAVTRTELQAALVR